MGKREVRNWEKLYRVESIVGKPIPTADIDFLIKTASSLNIISIEVGSADSLSKPKRFFVNNNTKFVYVRDGKQIPYTEIEKDFNKYFIAYQLHKQKMFVTGYFPGETD